MVNIFSLLSAEYIPLLKVHSKYKQITQKNNKTVYSSNIYPYTNPLTNKYYDIQKLKVNNISKIQTVHLHSKLSKLLLSYVKNAEK